MNPTISYPIVRLLEVIAPQQHNHYRLHKHHFQLRLMAFRQNKKLYNPRCKMAFALLLQWNDSTKECSVTLLDDSWMALPLSKPARGSSFLWYFSLLRSCTHIDWSLRSIGRRRKAKMWYQNVHWKATMYIERL